MKRDFSVSISRERRKRRSKGLKRKNDFGPFEN